MTLKKEAILRARLLSGGAWTFGARVCSGILGLGTYAILSRLISPAKMGAYFLAASVVSLGSICASLGTKDAAVRFIAESVSREQQSSVRKAIVSALQLGGAGAALSALLYFGLGRFLALRVFHQPELALAGGMIAVWITLSGLQSVAGDLFRGLQEYRLSALFTGTPGLAAGLALFILLFLSLILELPRSFQIVIGMTVASLALAVSLAGLWLATKLRQLPSDGDSTYRWRNVFAVAWPMLVSNLLIYAISQADLWCVGVFCPRDEVALYGAAWRLAQVVALPIAIANAVVPPLIAELHARKQKAELECLLRRSASWGGIPAIIACLVALIAGDHILGTVYGQFYGAAAVPLALLSVGQAANVLAGSSGFVLMMTGNEKTMMAITFATGALFFTGELLAVPRLGINGAACVAALAMILQNVLMLLFVKRRLGIWTHAEFRGLRLGQPLAASATSTE